MRIRRAALGLVVPALLATCSEPPAGPGASGPARIAIQAVAPPSLAQFATTILTVDSVQASLIRGGRQIPETLATRTVPFGANSSTINVSFNLAIDSAETLTVDLEYRTITGLRLWSASSQVVVRPGSQASTPPLVPSYSGPGGNVASIAISPATGTVVAGNTLPFTVTALDIQGAPVDSFYLSWSATTGSVNALGVFQAPNSTGQVQIWAKTPNDVADTVAVTVLAAGASPLTGTVLDGSTQAVLANVAIEVRDATNALVASATTAADGSFTTGPLAPGVYTVTASLNGFVTATLFDALLGGGVPITVQPIPLVPSSTQLGDLSGKVKDATTGDSVVGAVVELRAGVNAITGSPIATTTTDTGGNYSFVRQAAGTYTVLANIPGFTPGSRTSVVLGGQSSLGQDVSLSPIGTEQVRIVLTWGASPFDLDAHLTGPSTLGGRFHIYYANQGSLTSDPFAAIDLDDTDSFGPETTTISSQSPGTYRFSVHDFSNALANPSSALAASGAKVDLYIMGALVRSFFVPNQPGTLWTVFTLSGTTVTPVNTMSYVTDETTIPIVAAGTESSSDGPVIERDLARHPK
ncbi:MAG TPA: carboxypeptidase-like regulatory domain-containing protein [Gemmatimonadales bacterium]|jgi:hypothetical protein